MSLFRFAYKVLEIDKFKAGQKYERMQLAKKLKAIAKNLECEK